MGDRKGVIAVFLAAAILPTVGFLGVATDAARGYLVQARLSRALDAAALAGGRVMFSPNRDADIQMYFDANFPPGYLGATVTGPTFTVDANSEVITLSASATIDTTFMHAFGFDTLNVSAETEVTRQTQMLDVVLAIDMSGSMGSGAPGGGTRIQAARNAATALINILFGNDETKPLLNIGLVPWSAKVNVMRNGEGYDDTLTTTQVVPAFTNPITGAPQTQVYIPNNSPVPLLAPPPPDWQGCVYQRYLDDGDDLNDADLDLYEVTKNGFEWFAWELTGPEGEPVPGWTDCALAIGGNECQPCLDHGITPIQNTKTIIQNAIDELTSPTGTTNIPEGLAWAWRVLMPGAPFAQADPDPDFARQQAIVLLTDGENHGGSGDGYKGVFGLGTGAGTDMNPRLVQLADNIKAGGVTIYTIQFANGGGALQALMKSVATEPDAPYYHYAPDAATLQQVFQEIANHLSELRLSK
ncbi:MAG: VWA domain-containing protein [Alphaproteobacteria bacterium]|nr:VWA domain-containing protein [Alphaproteobacteria bacterium]